MNNSGGSLSKRMEAAWQAGLEYVIGLSTERVLV